MSSNPQAVVGGDTTGDTKRKTESVVFGEGNIIFFSLTSTVERGGYVFLACESLGKLLLFCFARPSIGDGCRARSQTGPAKESSFRR